MTDPHAHHTPVEPHSSGGGEPQRFFAPAPSAHDASGASDPVPTGYAPPPAAPAPTFAAGWYSDPQDPRVSRYWDGTQWRDGNTPVTPEPVRRKRISRGAIAAIVGGVVVLVVGGVAALALVLPRLEDSFLASMDRDPNARDLEAGDITDWTTIPVMDGAATVALDPAWEDISEYVDSASMEALLSEEAGVDIRVHGTWLTSGEIWTGGTAIDIVSIADAGGPSSARLEANAYMMSVRADFDDVVITSEGPVRTEHGYQGYVIEYEAPLLADLMVNTVGIVIDDHRQLLVQSSGLSESGSGVEHMEAVLDSLVIE